MGVMSDPPGARVSVSLKSLASILAITAVASPVHDAGSCWGPYITDAPSSLASATPLAVSISMWAALVAVVWSLWFPSTTTHAAVGTAVAAALWWLAAIEMNREMCDGSRPAAGLFLGWGALVTAAWSLPGRDK